MHRLVHNSSNRNSNNPKVLKQVALAEKRRGLQEAYTRWPRVSERSNSNIRTCIVHLPPKTYGYVNSASMRVYLAAHLKR